jgi:hypothetical protein
MPKATMTNTHSRATNPARSKKSESSDIGGAQPHWP